jgi:Tfp pilus assembly protein PilN
MTLVSEDVESPTIAWRLFASGGLTDEIAQALRERGETAVEVIDPLVGWQVDTDANPPEPESPDANEYYYSAALAGAAWDYFHGVMPIDLLHPKKAPPPPNPLIRQLVLGAGVCAAVAIGGYVMWMDIAEMRDEVARLESDVANAKKLTAKVQERADQVNAVENWLADQVDWLAELGDLSARFPEGESATVRRLTAAIGNQGATIDLSVQVAKQEDIAQLEERLRTARHDATSQRINQSSDSEEYPWQFETKVTFPVERVDSRAYASPALTKSPSDEKVQK